MTLVGVRTRNTVAEAVCCSPQVSPDTPTGVYPSPDRERANRAAKGLAFPSDTDAGSTKSEPLSPLSDPAGFGRPDLAARYLLRDASQACCRYPRHAVVFLKSAQPLASQSSWLSLQWLTTTGTTLTADQETYDSSSQTAEERGIYQSSQACQLGCACFDAESKVTFATVSKPSCLDATTP